MENEYNFPVELTPMFTQVGGKLEVEKRRAVLRTDIHKVIGVVSDKYVLLKHKSVIELVEQALEKYDYEQEVKLVNNGRHLFAKYTLNDVKIEVAKGDIIKAQLIVKNSYDGSNSLQISLGAYRVACSNGMIIGKSFIKFTQRHIGSMELGGEDLFEKVEALISSFTTILPSLKKMVGSPYALTVSEFKEKSKKLPKYLVQKAVESYFNENDFTVWGYYNALTNAITHEMKNESVITQIEYGKIAWKLASNQN